MGVILSSLCCRSEGRVWLRGKSQPLPASVVVQGWWFRMFAIELSGALFYTACG